MKKNITNTLIINITTPILPYILSFFKILPYSNNSIFVVTLFQVLTLLTANLTLNKYNFIKYKNEIISLFSLIILEIILFLLGFRSSVYEIIIASYQLINFILLINLLTNEKTYIDKNKMIFYIKFWIIISTFFNYNMLNDIKNIVSLNINPYNFVIKSFFFTRNGYGQFLFVFKVLLHLFGDENDKVARCIQNVSFFFLMLTMSRTSILAYFIFIFINNKKERNKIIIISIIFLIAIISVSKLRMIINTFFIRADIGTSGRSNLWIYAINLIEKRPFIGYGNSTTLNLISQKFSNLTEFHNTYLEIMVNRGLIPFLTILYIISSWFKRNIDLLKTKFSLANKYKSVIFSVSIYSLFESARFLEPGLVGTLFTFLIIATPAILYKINIENY